MEGYKTGRIVRATVILTSLLHFGGRLSNAFKMAQPQFNSKAQQASFGEQVFVGDRLRRSFGINDLAKGLAQVSTKCQDFGQAESGQEACSCRIHGLELKDRFLIPVFGQGKPTKGLVAGTEAGRQKTSAKLILIGDDSLGPLPEFERLVELVLSFFEATEVQKGRDGPGSILSLFECLQGSLAQAPCGSVMAHAGKDVHAGQIDSGCGVVVSGSSKQTGSTFEQA